MVVNSKMFQIDDLFSLSCPKIQGKMPFFRVCQNEIIGNAVIGMRNQTLTTCPLYSFIQ